MDKNYYITTPIYYPSAKPHMGHAYSSIIADFFARFKKIQGFNVFFLTGTDEHGQKIQRAAEKKGMEPLKFCDEISETFRNLSKILNLSNDDFIRTTENRHHKAVTEIWNRLVESGDIYLDKYSVFNTSRLLEISPFCFPPPPITNILLHPLFSAKLAIYFSNSNLLIIVRDGK